MQLPAVLKRQIGPFPAGVWLIIIAAGVGIGVALNREIGTVSEADEVLEVVDTGRDPYGAGTGTPAPGYRGPTLLNPGPVQPDTGTEWAATTNDEWLKRAQAEVAKTPDAPMPLTVVEALTRYLNGEALSATDRQIVNVAIGKLGPPPLGVLPAVPEVPSAPPTSPTVPGGGSGGYTPPRSPSPSGTLINTETGRPAFTGPSGEGGLAPNDPRISDGSYPGLKSWEMPDGRVAYYVPGQNVQAGNLGALNTFAA